MVSTKFDLRLANIFGRGCLLLAILHDIVLNIILKICHLINYDSESSCGFSLDCMKQLFFLCPIYLIHSVKSSLLTLYTRTKT